MNISGLPSFSYDAFAGNAARQGGSSAAQDPTAPKKQATDGSQGAQKKPNELSKADQEQVRRLQERDRDVRQHEQAHLAASGGLATSGATYSYQRGPDGVSYAVGGEVHISLSPGRSPQETITRAETIAAAALAPADPSAQDRAVAAKARQMELEAQAELRQQNAQEAAAALKQGDSAQQGSLGAKIGKYLEIAGASSTATGTGTAAGRLIDVTA